MLVGGRRSLVLRFFFLGGTVKIAAVFLAFLMVVKLAFLMVVKMVPFVLIAWNVFVPLPLLLGAAVAVPLGRGVRARPVMSR